MIAETNLDVNLSVLETLSGSFVKRAQLRKQVCWEEVEISGKSKVKSKLFNWARSIAGKTFQK